MVAFGQAVNVTLGLPIIRTSVDHGTAFDIAGKGIADPESMVQAVLLAARLATSGVSSALRASCTIERDEHGVNTAASRQGLANPVHVIRGDNAPGTHSRRIAAALGGMEKMTEKTAREAAQKNIAENRKAFHDYHVLETFEAGVALLGHRSEIDPRRAREPARQLRAGEGRGSVRAQRAHPAVQPSRLRRPSRRCGRESCCCTATKSAS